MLPAGEAIEKEEMTDLATMSVVEARHAGYSRAAWLSAVSKTRPASAPTVQVPKAKPPPFNPNYPCAHRGGKVGTTPCRTCGGTEQLDMHACSKHGRCTIRKLANDKSVRLCQLCKDRQLFEEEVPFAGYMDRYAGRTGWVIGSGPTTFDYRELADVTDPVFTINNWAWTQQYVRHDDQFWFALDSELQSWLPDLKGVAVLDLNEEGGGGSKWGKDRKSAFLVGGKKMCFWQSTPGLAGGKNYDTNQHLLDQPKDVLQQTKRLYRYKCTIIPLLHFAWYAGFTALNLVGCKGDTEPGRMYDERGLPYIRTGSPQYRNYRPVRKEQDKLLERWGITATYIG